MDTLIGVSQQRFMSFAYLDSHVLQIEKLNNKARLCNPTSRQKICEFELISGYLEEQFSPHLRFRTGAGASEFLHQIERVGNFGPKLFAASRVVGDDDAAAAAAVENDAHVKSSRKNGRHSGKQILFVNN
ncbi:hypothetical protein GQX74_005579 [Glossina fuscipes]|nr:hypothetical protein GQX74_005579 [Glossina fuscipes]